jgi:hypothetical protein
MCRRSVLDGAALLMASSCAQQPETTQNRNPSGCTQSTYNWSVEVMPGYEDIGLFGLLGLTGLFGLS